MLRNAESQNGLKTPCIIMKRFQLQAEQSDWLADTDEEIDEQELEAHYSYMAKIQEVPNADSGTDAEPLEQVQYDTDDNVFANDIQHFEQSESITNTCAVETGDSNVIPDSPDMCDNDIQDDQNDVECDDERVALANLIANLKLDVDENKKIQKQLKKANATLTQELTECKSILAETSRTLGESNSIRDSCLVALQNKQTEFERYKAFNDRTVDYDKLERKLNETLGLLAQKEIDIKEGLVKEKTKVITDLKLKEEKDIDKMISLENQLKFLNEIVYKRSQSIQTIHMLAPKCPTFNGRPTFANPMYLKKAQNEIPCLYAIPHDQSNPANRLVPDREETPTLDNESRFPKPEANFRKGIGGDGAPVVVVAVGTAERGSEGGVGRVRRFGEHKCWRLGRAGDGEYRTKKPNVVPISTRNPKSQANKFVATPHKKTVASESTTTNSKSYYRMLYKRTSKAWKWWIAQQ
ncbi:hypothetical protein Tco_0583702 [Tanacetum coccineum]